MKKNAFTLIELSIVLITIALLIASVTFGKTLIEQGQIRSYAQDIKIIERGFATFKLQYDGIPGDLDNAVLYWGSTGNGNGNEIIEYSDTGGGEEYIRAWEQLSLSNLIGQSLTYSVALSAVTGVNIFQLEAFPEARVMISSRTENIYGFTGSHSITAELFSTEFAQKLDLKLDDGKASKGNIISMRPSLGVDQCVDADWTASSANFKTNDATIKCRVWNYLEFE